MALTFLAVSRFLFGSAYWLAPEFSSNLISIPFEPNAAHPYRLFGIRDAVVGGLLWSAHSPELKRQALIAGLVVDVSDIISTGLGLVEGSLDVTLAAWTAGGAALGVALAIWILRDMSSSSSKGLKAK